MCNLKLFVTQSSGVGFFPFIKVFFMRLSLVYGLQLVSCIKTEVPKCHQNLDGE